VEAVEPLGHLDEPSYRERLLAMAEAVREAVPGVTGDADRWASKIVKARNTFAHRPPQPPPDAARVDEWLTVAASLRWLLTGVLLLQTGLAPDALGRRLEQHEPYQLFRHQARSWLPAVYGT